MATATAHTTKPDVQWSMGDTFKPLMEFFNNPIIVAIVVIGGLLFIVCIIIITVIMKSSAKEHKEMIQKDGALRKCLELKQACLQNQDKRLIKQEWSPLNLMFYFPLIFPGIITQFLPVFKTDRSLRIYDHNNNALGFYRGHTIDNGELILAFYRSKTWLFFEDVKLLRCLLTFDYEEPMKDNEGNIVYEQQGNIKTPKMITKTNNKFSNLVRFVGWDKEHVDSISEAKQIYIQCDGFKILDHYYFVPNVFFVNSENKRTYHDFSFEFATNTEKRVMAKVAEDVLSKMTDVVDKASQANPEIAKQRHRVERTESEVNDDQN